MAVSAGNQGDGGVYAGFLMCSSGLVRGCFCGVSNMEYVFKSICVDDCSVVILRCGTVLIAQADGIHNRQTE